MGGKLSDDDMLAPGDRGEACPSQYEEYCVVLFPGIPEIIDGDGYGAGYGFAWCELESTWDML